MILSKRANIVTTVTGSRVVDGKIENFILEFEVRGEPKGIRELFLWMRPIDSEFRLPLSRDNPEQNEIIEAFREWQKENSNEMLELV